MPMTKAEVEKMCEELADELNKVLAEMTPEGAHAALDSFSRSWFYADFFKEQDNGSAD